MTRPLDDGSALFAAVWRWHGFAGLLVCPLLLISAITGGIYLFAPEVDALQYPALFAPVTPGVQPLDALVRAAQAAVPDGTPQKMKFAQAFDRPTEILFQSETRGPVTVVVDPGTAQVRGEMAESSRVTALAFQVHTDIFAGFWGSVLLELGVSWGLVLILTGLFLWWPRGGRGLFAALTPRLRSAGLARWRDLHAVWGVWLAVPALMLMLTGLPWTAIWGDLFTRAAHAAGAGFPNEVFWWRPKSELAADLTRPRLDAEQVWRLVQARTYPRVVELFWPRTPDEAWVVRGAMGYDPSLTRYTFVDPVSGAILAEQDWKDVGAMNRPVSYGVSLHMGLLFGNWNRLLSLLGVLGVVGMVVTAPILWWKRRPGRATVFPPPAPLKLLPRWVWGVIVALMVFLPVAGASFVLIAGLDGVWRKIVRRRQPSPTES